MLRWLMLIVTFIVWAACMLVVYTHCKPPELANDARTLQAGMDTLFDPDAEPRRVWRIFVDLERLKPDAPRDVAPWNGHDERELREVGWLDTVCKKREGDESRLEQLSEAELAAPRDSGVPVLELLGTLHYQSRADVSMDKGLEVFSAIITMGLGLSANTHGVKENGVLKVTQQVFQNDKKLLDEMQAIPVGEKGTPLVDLFPFQQNRAIRNGLRWDIAILDASVTDVQDGARPRIVPLTVTCTGRQWITHEGERREAFVVSSADGKARAWYSADGIVLKQAYSIADRLEVMVVRADPIKFRPHTTLRWHGNRASR